MSADLALAADPSIVERAADPAEFIIAACERAKAWLREALDHGDIEQIVECKSQAEAIRVYTMSKQLGKDAQLSAAQIVRRAERGIGVAVRRAQERGELHRKSENGGRYQHASHDATNVPVPPVSTFFANGQERVDCYAMTDGITEEDFEKALSEAAAEENLSRANVVRKVRKQQGQPAEWIPEPGDRGSAASLRRREIIRDMAGRGYSSRQMSDALGTLDVTIRQIARDCDIEIPADDVIGKTRHHDSNRIVRETVHSLEGMAMGLQLVELDDLDTAEIKNWTISLTDSIRVLSRLNKQMREIIQ